MPEAGFLYNPEKFSGLIVEIGFTRLKSSLYIECLEMMDVAVRQIKG
jgi:hypothetical protein